MRSAVQTASASTAVPIVRITFGPAGRTNLTNPTFGYESNDLEARIECRIDSAPFKSCGLVEEEAVGNGPEGQLTEGPHTFEVRAVDAANPHLPIAVDRHGLFRDEYPPNGEPIGEEEPAIELLVGSVGPRFLVGEYSLRYGGYFGSGTRERHETCQTGAFPPQRSRPVGFRARRVRAG